MMQATLTLEKADPAGALNANGVVGKFTDASFNHDTATAQLQALLDQLTAQARGHVNFLSGRAHPSKLTMMELNQQEQEVSRLTVQLANVMATLDSRRRALVSERSYRQAMPASAHRERGLGLLS